MKTDERTCPKGLTYEQCMEQMSNGMPICKNCGDLDYQDGIMSCRVFSSGGVKDAH